MRGTLTCLKIFNKPVASIFLTLHEFVLLIMHKLFFSLWGYKNWPKNCQKIYRSEPFPCLVNCSICHWHDTTRLSPVTDTTQHDCHLSLTRHNMTAICHWHDMTVICHWHDTCPSSVTNTTQAPSVLPGKSCTISASELPDSVHQSFPDSIHKTRRDFLFLFCYWASNLWKPVVIIALIFYPSELYLHQCKVTS